MRRILFTWVVFFLLLPPQVSWAASANDNAGSAIPCGMKMGESGLVVDPSSGAICKEDVAFQGMYLMFASVLSDPALKSIVGMFVSDEALNDDFIRFANDTINVSTIFYYVMFGVAAICWIFITIILSVRGYQLFFHLKKTGSLDFPESRRGDLVKFVAYVTFLILLVMPAGFSSGANGDKPPLMVGQVLAVMLGLPAIQGGNAMYAAYLSGTEAASVDVPVKEGLLLPVGQGLSNAMVEGKLCELNTRLALMNMNAKAGSSFFESTSPLEAFDYDHDNVSERYDLCLAYLGDTTEGPLDDTIGQLSLNKDVRAGDSRYCRRLTYGYNNEAYGEAHTCMRMNFNFGQDKFANLEDLIDGDIDGLDSLKNSLKASRFYPKFKAAVEGQISAVLDNERISSVERFYAIDKVVLDASQGVFGDALSSQASLRDGTNEQRQARHLAAAGFLLGGTVDMGFGENFFSNGLSALWSRSRLYPGSAPDDRVAYGVDVMLLEARDIANLIRQYHCATNWDSNASARKFVLDYNRTEDGDDIAQVLSGGEVKLQCVEILHESKWGATDKDRYVTYTTQDPRAFDDYEPFTGDDSGWRRKPNDDASVASTSEYMRNDVAKKLQKEIQLRQFILAGYSAAAKKAITDSLVDSLSVTEIEGQRDINLRPRGWGMFGGALLYTSQTQLSAMHMARSLDDVVGISSSGTDARFVAREAFGAYSESREKTLGEIFAPYDGARFFTVGPNGTGSYSGPSGVTPEMDESSALQYIMYLLESLLLGPTDHIKAASGMPANKSLSDGFQNCFDNGYDSCLSGTKHPIVAMSNFGNEMINNMVVMLMATEIVNFAADGMSAVLDKEEGEIGGVPENTKKKGVLDKTLAKGKELVSSLKGVAGGWVMVLVNVAFYALKATAVILGLLKPLFATLLVVGIVFAYIVPMMAFLYGYMAVGLFLVFLFISCIAIPLSITSKLLTIERDYQNGFKLLFQEYAGGYLSPLLFSIGAAFSWTMIVVMMYGLNTTFSLITHGLSASGSAGIGISSFLFAVLVYVLFFLSVFVLFRFGLGFMKTFPDMVRDKLNLKRSDEDAYMSSLGFEQYVNATVMTQLAKMPAEGLAALRHHMDKSGYASMDDLRAEVARAEKLVQDLGLTNENAEGVGKVSAQKAAQMQQDAGSGSGASGRNQDTDNGGNDSGRQQSKGGDPQNPTGKPTATPESMRPASEAPQPGDKPEIGPTGKPKVIFTEGDATTSDGNSAGAPDNANSPQKPTDKQ